MKKTIPLFRAQSDAVLDELSQIISDVIHSRWYILGKEVTEFEREFATYCGVTHCVSVANGTDALELSLRALGVTAGDTVLLVANAAFYGSAAVHLIGAVPYYVDIDPKTRTFSPENLTAVISNIKPKAIIVTHLYGQLAAIEDIVVIANKFGIPVIEDCAQAHGAKRQGKYAGSFGTLACFSFYPTKNLGALGDGGAVVTSDDAIAKRLKQLRQYGWGAKYHIELPGGRNSRLDEIQAAILRKKLPDLDRCNAERRTIARQYNTAFKQFDIRLPASVDEDYVAHLYVIQIEQRDAFREFLKQHGVTTDIHYPIPDHLQTAYQCDQTQGSLPVTEQACEKVVSLPCFPGMTNEEIEQVIRVVKLYFETK